MGETVLHPRLQNLSVAILESDEDSSRPLFDPQYVFSFLIVDRTFLSVSWTPLPTSSFEGAEFPAPLSGVVRPLQPPLCLLLITAVAPSLLRMGRRQRGAPGVLRSHFA